MKALLIFIGAIVGFFLPALIAGYLNWDITYITTIGEWSGEGRGFFLYASIMCMGTGGFIASFYEPKDKS